MDKRTPGPWKAIKTPESTYYDDQVQIGRDRIGVYSEADARLIAAAPEPLEALQRLCDRSKKSPSNVERAEIWSLARAAIAKATGEQA